MRVNFGVATCNESCGMIYLFSSLYHLILIRKFSHNLSTQIQALCNFCMNVCLQISLASAGGILSCIMDSGNIALYDLEIVFKQILAEQISERRAATEASSEHQSRAKVRKGKVPQADTVYLLCYGQSPHHSWLCISSKQCV